MMHIKSRNLMVFSSLLTAFLLIGFMNLMKVRDETITGHVIEETTGEKASLVIVFLIISVIAGAMMFLTIMHHQYRRF